MKCSVAVWSPAPLQECGVAIWSPAPLWEGAWCCAAVSCHPVGSFARWLPAPDAGGIASPAETLPPGMVLPFRDRRESGFALVHTASTWLSPQIPPETGLEPGAKVADRPIPAAAGVSRLVGVGGCFCCANAWPPPQAGLSPARWYCYSYGQFSVFEFCKTILRKISPWCCWLSSRLEIAFPCLKFLPEFQMENVQLHFPS